MFHSLNNADTTSLDMSSEKASSKAGNSICRRNNNKKKMPLSILWGLRSERGSKIGIHCRRHSFLEWDINK